jgi:plastocyanin
MPGGGKIPDRAVIAVAAGIGGALLAPAGLLAGSPQMVPAGAGTPVAAIDARPGPVAVGENVRLDSSRSSDPGGAIVQHLWDLDGDGRFETDTGSQAVAATRPAAPGTVRIGLRIVDDRGRSAETTLELTATARARPRMRPAPRSAAAAGAPRRAARAHAAGRRRAKPAPVRPAASGGVSIQGFAFHPGSISVGVGDTVTWTNQDSVAHTATANDGSFNTGTLKKGQSASHTFPKAGTFAYICAIHPNMKGTVTVTGASAGGGSSGGGNASGSGSGSSPSSSSPSSSTPSASGAGSSGAGALPHTGLELASVVLLAALMIGGGTLLRHRLHE